ncbi:Imm1 family immunity protein [Saccharopolyspora sp. 5N708]|uniref:Imm1 family immunity protein n=1 Tax=Saccharopolyspora sp. 5N708 TaxID=3457424 RepID=UPI003FCFC7C2
MARLVQLIVDEPHLDHTLVFVWDRECRQSADGTVNEFPPNSLRVFTDPEAGWGALSYHHWNVDLSDSYNPAGPADAPALFFDPAGGLLFPKSAALPLGQVRAAVVEFCRTGARSECIEWQPGQYC